MLLKLALTFGAELEFRIRSVRIVRWHKSVGEPVAYGDDLVDIEIREVYQPKQLKEVSWTAARLHRRPGSVKRG